MLDRARDAGDNVSGLQVVNVGLRIPGASFARAYSVSTFFCCGILLPPRSSAPPATAATPVDRTRSPASYDSSADAWRNSASPYVVAHRESGADARAFATKSAPAYQAAVSVRRARLAVPVVTGGAYERGASSTSRIRVETL